MIPLACPSHHPTQKARSFHAPSSPIIRLGIALCLLGLLPGCAAIKRAQLQKTELFYRAENLSTYPPKPPGTPIPTLDKQPPRSAILGRFEFSTLKGSAFALEAAQHNARRVGADAIVLRSLHDWIQPYSYYVPPETNSIPRSRWVSVPVWRKGSGNTPGHWETERRLQTDFVFEYRPGHTVSGSHTHSIIDALMIRVP